MILERGFAGGRKITMVLRPKGEGNQVRMWYKSMVFLLGNLTSTWHANRTSKWLA